MDAIEFHGVGLHSGAACSVRLVRTPGPLLLIQGDEQAAIDELSLVRAERGVRVHAGGLDVELVEHLFSALGGLGVFSQLRLEIGGPEVPLLDGGALELATAIAALNPRRAVPRLKIRRAANFSHGAAEYEFSPAEGVALEVDVEFGAPRIGRQSARWNGDPRSYLRDIAPARTFGFQRDASELRQKGLARHVDPSAVMVLDDDGSVLPPGAAALPEEFARHKLLDLVGDLFLYGGPPLGRIHARRPGHAATHAVVKEAFSQGVLERSRPQTLF